MRELLAYISECWGTAIAIRERRKATLSMLAAFIALPVVLVFGGKPEFTSQGLVFVAEWLFVSAFFYVFVLAPFLVWKDQRRALVALKGTMLPRLGSLPFHNLSAGILIEPDGVNRREVMHILDDDPNPLAHRGAPFEHRLAYANPPREVSHSRYLEGASAARALSAA